MNPDKLLARTVYGGPLERCTADEIPLFLELDHATETRLEGSGVGS
jgi:hypothetical protein